MDLEEFKMLYGRQKEQAEILSKLLSEQSELIFVYGRRRIGKTTLINETLKKTEIPVLCFYALETTPSDNLALLSGALRDFFKNPLLSFPSFDAVMSFLYQQAQDKPLVFFIDEYPRLKEERKTDSELQKNFDLLARSSHLKVILSGSYIASMRDSLKESSPLFGRPTLILALEGLDYYETANFYPLASLEEKVAYYAAFGGTPYFPNALDPKLSFEENLCHLFLEKNAFFETEIRFELRYEVGKIEGANLLLSALAGGYKKYAELRDIYASKNPTGNCDYVLSSLVEMGLVKKLFAHNKAGLGKPYYQIADNAFLFYFTYVYPYVGPREIMDTHTFFNQFVAPSFYEHYLPLRFEAMAQDFLIRRNKASQIDPPFFEIGRFLYDNPKEKISREFDIVSKDAHGYIAYECKYTNAPLTMDLVQKEASQIKDVTPEFYRLSFFSKNGADSAVLKSGYQVYSLSDLYRP